MQRATRTGRPAPLFPCGRRKTRACQPRPHLAKEREIKCHHYYVVPWPVHRIFMGAASFMQEIEVFPATHGLALSGRAEKPPGQA